MGAHDSTVLIAGEGAVAERARARLAAAGYRVAATRWARSDFTEVEKRPGPAESAGCDVLLAFPAADAGAGLERWPPLLERVRSGGLVIVAGSMPPRAAAALAGQVTTRGLAFLDAPCSADGGAIPVGGDETSLEKARPLLECLGTPTPQGEPGTGQQARLCGEIALGSMLIGLSEALVYARAAGLDAERLLSVLPGVGEQGGLALRERVRRLLDGEAGDTERVEGLVADADAVLEEAESIELDLPGLELVRLVYQEIADMGFAESGAEAIAALWQEDDEPPPDLVQIGRR